MRRVLLSIVYAPRACVRRYTFSTLISLYSALGRQPLLPETFRESQLTTRSLSYWFSLHPPDKWMFSPEHYGFGFPLFVTACHMLVQFVLCSLVLSIFPSLRPAHRPEPRGYAWVLSLMLQCRLQVADPPTCQSDSTKVVPCGLATGLDIGLSNLSLKTITLSFYSEQLSCLRHS